MSETHIFTVGGTVQASNGLYIPRQADDELLALCRAGSFAYVLTPRQLGKSSLMVSTAEQLTVEGVRSVVIDLSQIGVQVTPEEWYLGLLSMIEEQLDLDTDAVSWWRQRSHLGVTQRLTMFFEDVLLKEVNAPMVVFVDEIDTTLSLNFTDDFFAAIRYFYNARARSKGLQRLSFVLIGVATPGDLIRDPQRTPFNIGQRVDLTDFTFEEAFPLAAGLGLPDEEARQVLGWVMKWTGGHPYLTQRLCRALTDSGRTNWSEAEVDALVSKTFFGKISEEDNNLQFVRDMLTKRAPDLSEVLYTYREVLRNKRPVPDEEQSLIKSHLKLSGVAQRRHGELSVRNPIYAEVFSDTWVKEHLPVNWFKRARRAGLPLAFAFVLIAAVFASLTAVAANMQRVSATKFAAEERARAEASVAEAEHARAVAEDQRSEAERQRMVASSRAKEAEISKARSEDQRRETEQQRILANERSAEAQRLRDAADKQRETAFVNQLSSTAKVISSQPNLLPASVLLSVEALQRLRPPFEANQVLLSDLYLLPRPFAKLEHSGSVRAIAFSPDGKSLATASEDQKARVWDAATGREVSQMTHGDQVNAIAFSPDGKYLATASGSWKVEPIRIRGETFEKTAWNESRGTLGPNDYTARVWEASSGREVLRLAHNEPVTSVAFSSDGRYLATGSFDYRARIWEVASGIEFKQFEHKEGSVHDVAFSSNGGYLVTRSGNSAFVWEVASGRQIARVSHDTKDHGFQMNGVALSPDGKYLATASLDRTARLWEVSTGHELARVSHKANVEAVAFSPDSKYLATASSDATTEVIAVPSGCELTRLRHDGEVTAVAFSSDAKYVVTASADNTARIWERATGREVTRAIEDAAVNAVALSPDGKYLATRSSLISPNVFMLYGKAVRLWEVAGGADTAHITHDDYVNDVEFSPDGRYVATASSDYTARIWDLESGRETVRMKHEAQVWTVTFSPNGKYVATASNDGTARIWETATGHEVARMENKTPLLKVIFSPDGRYLATMDFKGANARVWETTTGRPISTMTHKDIVRAIAFSPDGRYLATGTSYTDHTARLWDVFTGREIRQLKHDDWITAITFSPDGRYLATASASHWSLEQGTKQDNTARIWDVNNGREIARLQHDGPVWGVAFSPDGTCLATASADQTARVWAISNGKEIARMKHQTGVATVVFSRDGRFIATGGWLFSNSKNNAARIWDAKTGQEINRITHDGEVYAIAFSPDGKYLASAGADNTARVSRWQPDDLIAEACTRLTRNLTIDEWRQYFPNEPYRKTCPSLPISPSLFDEARKLAKEGNLQGAVSIFRRAMELEPGLKLDPEAEARRSAASGKAEKLLQQVKALQQEDRVKDALTTYHEVVTAFAPELKTGSVPADANLFTSFGDLCWFGSLWGHPSEVMGVCRLAVELYPNDGAIRDSRGVARALTGDISGAIEDFEAFVNWTKDQAKKEQRQAWIKDLRDGKKPFNLELREKLRRRL